MKINPLLFILLIALAAISVGLFLGTLFKYMRCLADEEAPCDISINQNTNNVNASGTASGATSTTEKTHTCNFWKGKICTNKNTNTVNTF